MKNNQIKNILVPFLTIGFCMSVNAQVFNSGFEENNGPISEWTNINADLNPVEDWMPVPEFNDEAWVQFYDFYDNKIAFSTSFYMNGEPANDWLITPQINIPANGNPTLYWKAKSYDNTSPDTYAVKVSTTNSEMDSFINLVVIEGEQAYDFNKRTLDLSAYAGQSIYLAFVNETAGGYFLALDDVYISNEADCYAPSVESFSSNINADSYLSNPNSETISFEVSWEALNNIQLYDIGVTTFNVPVSSNGIQTSTNKLFTNMPLGTRYQMFVKNADCGSGWMGPKSIFTPSGLPYEHGFEPTDENFGEYDSDGWVSDTWIMGINNELAYEGEGYIFSNTSSSYETNKWLYSYPIIIAENTPIEVSFNAALPTTAADSGLLIVGITTSNEVGSYPIESESIEIVQGYNSFNLSFDNHPGGVVYVAFGNVTPVTTSGYALRLDDIKINKDNLSVTEVDAEEKFKIYPNPVQDYIHIASKGTVDNSDIFNSQGQLIMSSKKEKIHVGHLPKGVYILKVKTKNDSYSRKFIKK